MNAGSTENQSMTDTLCINAIRALCMDAIEQAKSGHPGAPLGLAPAAYVLWTRFLRHNPENPGWQDRDRFILSGGHASMLLYSLLFFTGYDITLDDLKAFRQWGSKTPGHPEYGHTPGVEITTGPLGQGLASAVGMAMAERHLAACFNRPGLDIVDHHTYVMCGDGDLMEGITSEAASLAGHLGLGKLICIYDDNRISIEGSTEITFTEDVALRFKAYDWQVLKVDDGNDLSAIEAAIRAAQAEPEKPTLIILRTFIAYGSPNKQGSADAHGAPLGEAEVRLTKRFLGCPEDELFCVPEPHMLQCRNCASQGAELERAWNDKFARYQQAHPDAAQGYLEAVQMLLPDGWDADMPQFKASEGPVATRSASGRALNALAGRIPYLVGGSADLAPSNKTLIEGARDFQRESYDGRNIRFGVREHAMAAILSGMSLHRGIRPYAGTFLVFADYMKPAIRLAALMKQPVIYVFTHDSLAVGEDGPTHQPIEHLASLRIIPGVTVIRPADAAETAEAWRTALRITDGPVALILSRQKLPVLDRAVHPPAGELAKGAYILKDTPQTPDIILIGTGAEVHLALGAAERLATQGVAARVVSMPSWELFEKTSRAYRESVFPTQVPRLAVEAGSPMGWERYVGSGGAIIGIDHFGASAPGSIVLEKFGFSVDNVFQQAMALLQR